MSRNKTKTKVPKFDRNTTWCCSDMEGYFQRAKWDRVPKQAGTTHAVILTRALLPRWGKGEGCEKRSMRGWERTQATAKPLCKTVNFVQWTSKSSTKISITSPQNTSPPTLHSNGLHATVSSHHRGNIPQEMVPCPPPPPITMQRMRDTKQVMQTQGHMNHEMSWEVPVWIHVQLYSTFSGWVFDSEELHMLNRGHRNGLSSCRLGCRLGRGHKGLFGDSPLFVVVRCCSEKMVLLSFAAVRRFSSLFMYKSVGNPGHTSQQKLQKEHPFQSAFKSSPQSEAIICLLLLTIPWPRAICKNTKWHPFGDCFQ